MTERKTARFVCTVCGYEDKYYHVVCPRCGAEDSMVEVEKVSRYQGGQPPSVFFLSDVENVNTDRISSGWKEFDYILGGGIATGSVILLAGPPGVGKSTLALMLTSSFKNPLYISGEENLSQIGLRAKRLNINTNLPFSFVNTLDGIKAVLSTRNVDFLIVDSLQVMRVGRNVSFISHNEARLFMSELVRIVKEKNITTLVLGHITKEGAVAGPKTVEHLVDVVVYLNNTSRPGIRTLHIGKNRFGPSDGVVFMEISEKGIFPLTERIVLEDKGEIGRTYTVLMQGNAPNIIDVQALVTTTYTNVPRRIISGYPSDRLYLLLAILEKKASLKLYNKDIFVKVSGDYFWKDTAIDLAIAAAIFSAYYNIPIPGNVVWVGEVDLLGNIRPPDNMTVRQRVVGSAGGRIVEINNIKDVKNIIQRWR